MTLPLLVTSKFAIFSAAAAGCGWTAVRWFQRRNASTLLEKDDVENSIHAFTAGSLGGLVLSLPYVCLAVVYHSIQATATTSGALLPLASALQSAVMANAVGASAFALFLLANRYNLAARKVLRDLAAQGHRVLCGDLAPILGLVFGNIGAFMLFSKSINLTGLPGLFYVDFFACALSTFFSMPSQPDVLSMRLRSQDDAESQIYWWLGILGGTVVALIFLPGASPVSWTVASTVMLLYVDEWVAIDGLMNFGVTPGGTGAQNVPKIPAAKKFAGKGRKLGESGASETATSTAPEDTEALLKVQRDAEIRAAAAERRRLREASVTSVTTTTTTTTTTTGASSDSATSSSSSSSASSSSQDSNVVYAYNGSKTD